jgi:hypothetical protein
MVFDAKQRLCQFRFKDRIIGIATEACEAPQSLRVGGQTLRLLVTDHLQPMLESAQLDVGRGKLIDRLPRDPALFLQGAQHVERAGATQIWPAATEDQLLGLHEKLDFADAAATEF